MAETLQAVPILPYAPDSQASVTIPSTWVLEISLSFLTDVTFVSV